MIIAFVPLIRGGRLKLRQMPYSYVDGLVTNRLERSGTLL